MDKTGVPKGDYAELKKILGNRLRVEGYGLKGDDGEIVRRHLADLDLLPKDLLKKVVDGGLNEVIAGPGSVPQLPGFAYLAKAKAYWGEEDITMLEVPGCYVHKERAVLLGTSPDPPPHMVPHEFAHSLTILLGYEDDIRAVRAYREALPYLDKFYAPKGNFSESGFREFLADAVAYGIMGRVDDLAHWPEYFKDFLINVVLKGRPPRIK